MYVEQECGCKDIDNSEFFWGDTMKKVITILLALLTAALLFTGCGLWRYHQE